MDLIEKKEQDMKTYYVAELQNINSYREADEIKANNLSEAMKIAIKMQVFQGTVMCVGEDVDDNGFIVGRYWRRKDRQGRTGAGGWVIENTYDDELENDADEYNDYCLKNYWK